MKTRLCICHALHASALRHSWHLTFDMSGGFGLAQPAQRRPLDGGVRPLGKMPRLNSYTMTQPFAFFCESKCSLVAPSMIACSKTPFGLDAAISMLFTLPDDTSYRNWTHPCCPLRAASTGY